MLVASVIVDVQARSLDRAFDYYVPTELAGVEVGCTVAVEFGHRPAVAYVVALEERGEADCASLKPLTGVLTASYFDGVSARLARWIADEYICPLPDAVRLFLPPGGAPRMKRVDGNWTLVRPGVGPVDDRWVFLDEGAEGFVPAPNAVKQQSVIRALSCGGMRAAELSLELGNVSSTLKALERRGVVRIETRRRMREAGTVELPDVELAALTQGQEGALAAIRDELARSEGGGVVVVDGITGSGKTEVYLRAIAHALEQGRSACVLVPEIALTPQTVGRFRARFGAMVAVLHSRLSAGERFDQWDLVHSGGARVVVGTRSALFAPLPDLGLIIIDEEHENTYKQESSPRYDARDVAREMARLRGATLVLGSATPSIATLAQGWRRAVLSERPSGMPLPPVTVVDMGAEFRGGSRSMFSAELSEALLANVATHEKSVLLLNKRGFASFVLCRECGHVPECPSCSVSLTFHERGNTLVCHHCGHHEPAPPLCPECQSPYLRKFGAGTQRVEDELAAIMPPGTSIVRMDADTTKGKGAHERLLGEFAASEGGILLGTQMIAKGLDFADVTLVGVINADTTLKLPDFRAGERTYQLVEQVSGRAGRAEKPGRVIVQTYSPGHPAIRAAAVHDRKILLDEELPVRRELGYPPYARLANILVWGRDEDGVRAVATELMLALSSACISADNGWDILGPAPCVLARLKGDWRWHILAKAPTDASFGEVIAPILAKRKPREGVRVAVDVDPVSLL